MLILLRQLPPQPRKIAALRPARSPNHLPVPPRVIMNIDNTMRARRQARLHQCIVLSKVGIVKSTAEDVVDEILPGDGEAEDVESVRFGKVRHLAGAVAATVFGEGWVDGWESAGALWEAVSTAKGGKSDDEKADVHR